MALQKLIIEDVSDCPTCEDRCNGELEMFAEHKCTLLQDVTCRDCGRVFDLVVEELEV